MHVKQEPKDGINNEINMRFSYKRKYSIVSNGSVSNIDELFNRGSYPMAFRIRKQMKDRQYNSKN
jgi:hypothetical protein